MTLTYCLGFSDRNRLECFYRTKDVKQNRQWRFALQENYVCINKTKNANGIISGWNKYSNQPNKLKLFQNANALIILIMMKRYQTELCLLIFIMWK